MISIHSLYAEGDFYRPKKFYDLLYFNPLPLRRGRPGDPENSSSAATFQSTPSTQRETVMDAEYKKSLGISIHSLYAEGDIVKEQEIAGVEDFNPLPLRRGRPNREQSQTRAIISIHSLYAEGDASSVP